MPYKTTDWYNLHSKSWGKELVAGMNHPAKAKIKLAERIYRHAIEERWVKEGDLCLDPFAGVGCFSLHAILNGLNWVGVELEENFVESAEKNIAAWRVKYKGMPHLGTAVVLQGDSRKLKEVLRGGELLNLLCSSPPFTTSGTDIGMCGAKQVVRKDGEHFTEYGVTEGQLGNMPIGAVKMCISSPPFQGQFPCQADNYEGFEHVGTVRQGAIGGKYGDDTEGNLSSMPAGDLIIASPPYIDSMNANSGANDAEARLRRMEAAGIDITDSKNVGGPNNVYKHPQAYGETEGQLGSMPVGDLCISSPPYSEGLGHGMHQIRDIDVKKGLVLLAQSNYGKTEGNLGNLPEGNLILSSPPYAGSLSGQTDGIDWSICKDGGKIRDFTNEPGQAVRLHMGKAYSDNEGNLGNLPEGNLLISSPPYVDSEIARNQGVSIEERHRLRAKGEWEGYGGKEGNLGNLPEGNLIISSPPYVESLASDDPDKRGGLFRDPRRHDDPTLTATYGDTVGQLGAMKVGGEEVNKLTSSPPYENMVNASGEGPGATHYSDSDAPSAQSCGVGYSKDNQNNLGNESGDTFWGAAKLIVGQCFDVLRPGAHAIFVLKNYIKAGKEVPFTQSWAALCEQCGFELIHWHKAWLIEDRGDHRTLDGGIVHKQVKRAGFFRILCEKRGSPPIDFESVLCFVKPVK